MSLSDFVSKFGFSPSDVGLRHRGYWIVEKIEEEEEEANAQIGDLCIKARDGGSNPIDTEAFKYGDFIGTSVDGFDCTYRYYYYRAVQKSGKNPSTLADEFEAQEDEND